MSAVGLIAALAAQTAVPPGTSAPEAAAPTSGAKASSIGAYTYVDLEAGAGYSTNPNLIFGSSKGSGFGRLSANAVHTRVSARTTTVLSAFAQSTFYTRHYGSQQSLDLNAHHDAQVNEKLRVFGDAGFTYDEGGQLDTRILALPTVPLLPGATEPPIISPTGDFISVRGKQYSASGHIGAQLALNARDSLNATTGIDYVHFKSGPLDTHYTTIPISLGYTRQISTHTTVGVRGTAQFTNYNGPGNTRILTPQFTIQTLLSERITFNAAVGASFAAIDDGVSTRHTTGVAANAGLCYIGEFDRLCAQASIDQQAATVVGPSKTITAAVDYSRKLDANQTIAFSLSASRYSTPFTTLSGSTLSHPSYFRGAADYTRKIGNRWFGGVSLAGRKVTQAGPDPKLDFSGSLYIRYRLGDLR